ncbi:hypothetical protein [Marinoscillum pacificum]|uniref:hypothetical protein n=1 Tax=Marinoscillum pacificum TaxID=392723 RepID=UPI0021584E4C|nr:hypothetical protein [Marinoscillum pacificum]
MRIDSRIIELLEKIDFAENYKKLVNTFSGGEFEDYSVINVETIFKDLGYDVFYNKKEDFFKVMFYRNDLEIQVNFSLKYGAVETILGIIRKGERIKVGGPFGFLYRSITSERLAKPLFSNYDQLKEIISTTLLIVKEIQVEISSWE